MFKHFVTGLCSMRTNTKNKCIIVAGIRKTDVSKYDHQGRAYPQSHSTDQQNFIKSDCRGSGTSWNGLCLQSS